jgi:mono/diheme cytochrome c family protein
MKFANCVILSLLFTSLLLSSTADAQDKSDAKIRFNDQVRPILSEHCFSCHGPDAASRKAELRLDEREGAVESGAVVPGKVDESTLINRILSDDPDEKMPPPDSGKELTAAEKELLAEWIAGGAQWEAHWAFISPVRPEVPSSAESILWSRNPIDHFVLKKAAEFGLRTNDASDRHALARRLALDITGLPLNTDWLDEFVNDDTEGAYLRLVDKLIKSPHAGEHRARYWLDAARYGDTHGMHVDNYREMWPYRDWVVQAFNSNMPFDQFVVQQIAGDLMPKPTIEQRIATGFSRCNITTSEGGAIPAEVEVRYMVDRVETTATVFLGLTAGCAVCHDHKYDPITQKEFYQLGAFFNNTTQPPMDGNQKDSPPVVVLPTEETKNEWDELFTRRQKLRTEIARIRGEQAEAEQNATRQWWEGRDKTLGQPIGEDSLALSLPLTEEAAGPTPKEGEFEWESAHPGGTRGMRFGEKSEFTAELPTLRSDEPLTVSFWFRTPDRLMATTLLQQTAQSEDKKQVGWRITSSTQGALTFDMTTPSGKKIRGLLPGEEALTPRTWQHVCVRYSGGQSNASISILVNGRVGVLRNSTETLIDAAELLAAPLKIATRVPTAGMSDLRIYQRWLTQNEVDTLAAEHTLRGLIASDKGWDDLRAAQQQQLIRYREVTQSATFKALNEELSHTQTRRDFIYSRSTTTLVMEERATIPKAWVLERGEYDQRRDEVAPGLPKVLQFGSFAGAEADGTLSRMDLAEWLIDPQHPLTSRVMVNRLWQSVFGTGLVRTTEDFGVMGEAPSHPELLDWLAVEFVESGWDVQHMIRLMVTSATYQQSTRVEPRELEIDRANRYLSRGPRIRLDAEVLRDQALSVGGLLRPDLGGPSVKPYQPAGLWKVVAITGSNTRVYEKDKGDALYRRSLYTFWKRTAPPPSMATFNAPTREQCTVRRERTNTPLQALVMMNDPQFVEAARHLAQRAMHDSEKDEQRVLFILERALRRPASANDQADLLDAVGEFRKLFTEDEKAAQGLIETGDSKPDATLAPVELASWTIIANTVMNRDDFINN